MNSYLCKLTFLSLIVFAFGNNSFFVLEKEDCSYRRVKSINLSLLVNRSYTPEELKQKGYILKKITLEGIIAPEAIPEDEEFVVYEVKKNNELVGWLWKEKFLDEEELKKRYELFVEAHARMDNIFADTENGLDEETLKKLDLLRNKMHLWADLFAKELYSYTSFIPLEKVRNDIMNKKMQLMGWNNFIIDGYDFGLFRIENKMVKLSYNYEKTEMWEYAEPEDVFYTDIKVIYIYRAIGNYWKEKGKAVLFDKISDVRTHFHTDDSGYKKSIGTITLLLNKELLPLVKAQFSYLKEHTSEIRPNRAQSRDVYNKLIKLLNEVDWNIYFEGDVTLESYLEMRSMGMKGYNLVKLKNIELPIPNFYILKTDEQFSWEDLFMEENYFLVSVRSSPSISMPGILDTVLDVGMDAQVVEVLTEKYGERFAYGTYARFLRSFGISVFGIDKKFFGNIPSDLSVQRAKELAKSYKKIIEENGFEIPQDPSKQLEMAIKSVKNSWNSNEARRYREENGIPYDLGLPVIIQEMKFGNLNENSGSFVLFTRDPITGEKGLYIEYAPQRQGEDLVSGSVNPVPVEESGLSQETIDKIKEYAEKIEKEFKYAQDIEGVIEKGKVWILQTRDAKLSPEAEIKVLVDMVNEGIVTIEEVLMRINLKDLEDRLSHMQIDPTVRVNPIATGLGASSGAVGGVIAFDLEDVKKYKNQGLPVILLKKEFYPATHLEELIFSNGLLTQIGGRLSHGAIQGRIHEKPTIVGVNIEVDTKNKTVVIGGKTYKEGDYITIDGTNGNIYEGRVALIEPEEANPYLEILRQWYEEAYGEK